MKKAETLQNPALLLSEETLVDFIEALYRIFKVGIYYPIGHVILDQTASKCVKRLREISPSLKCVKIKIEQNSLLVEEIKLPESSVSVKELQLLLERLGIRSIEIKRAISQQQLLYFVENLLTWRMQLESTQSFINFNVADLPDGIRLEQLEFLVDETSILHEDSANDNGQKLENLCIALGKQGLNKQQVEQCREFLEKLSDPPEGEQNEIKGFPNATWHDVQTLLYKVVTGSYSLDEQRFDSVANSEINVIASIFESLELSLSDKKSKETINFLISHLVGRKTDQSETVMKSAHPEKKLSRLLNDDQKLSVSELKAFIYENNVPLKILKNINSVDSSEEMSIILQLISPDLDRQLTKKLEQGLKTILTGRLTDRGKAVFIGGIRHFVDSGDVAYFRHLLAMVLQSLRDSEHLNSLDFVVDLWNKMPYAMHLLLWPFVVNELLIVGMGENREKFFEATEIASNMHANRMKNLCSQLEEMDAFQEKRVAENIFDPNHNSSYKFFAFLIETSLGDIIAEKILSGLRDKPQDPLFEAVGPLLEIMTPSHLEFVHSYLGQAHLQEPPLALKMAAGQIILDFLQNISKDKKELPWLQKTIAATTGLSVKGMQVMLRKIVKDKKMGVLPTWPKNCRIAADAALKGIKRRSLAELL